MTRCFRLSSLLAVLSLLLFVACSKDGEEIVYIERSVEEIYNAAHDALEKGDFRIAALEFDEVERQHPYSKWARRAMVMSAYAYYRQNKYNDAILT
ncbi:MAG: outer membrane protein assembly factor BamD, partial [Alphaproteobacteria bacterium]|nr:outer membrane protein assembly factor BamD [Alphaproteobacteria bacterium]